MQKKARNTAKAKPTLVYKPYLKGRCASLLAARRGLRILAYLLVFVLVYLFIGQALMFDSLILRLLLNIAALLGFAGLLYNDGAKMGLDDVSFAEIALQRRESGKDISSSELDRCFHPMKGFVSAAVGVLPIFLLALVFAMLTKEITYSLGGLPSWLQGFERRADVGQALAYYHEPAHFGLVDVLRVIVRLSIFPFINIVGADSSKTLLLLERLSPLLVLIVPAAFGLGYMQGHKLRARVHGAISSDAIRRVKRERRERKRRRQEPNQLV